MEIYNDAFQKFAAQYKDEVVALHAYANKLYDEGDFRKAIGYFVECINKDWSINQKRDIDVINQASRTCFAMRDFKGAYEFIKLALTVSPGHPQLTLNLGAASYRLGRYEDALASYLKVYEKDKNNIIAVEGVSASYAKLNKIKDSIKFGRLSLELKENEALCDERLRWLKETLSVDSFKIDKEILPFNPNTPERNIISYSLWGDVPQYTDNAVLNSLAVPVLYPGWRARFYCDDSVPKNVVERLKQNGSEVLFVQSKGAYYGLFWRFLVIDDPNVDRFLIRDCDSLVNCQERVAVDEWLQSDKHFHLMRDYLSHAELILGGMWGGVGGVIPNISRLVDAYYDKSDKERVMDQHFLRYCIWPFVRESHLAHDSYFDFACAKSFPEFGRFPSDKWHVGMNWSAYQRLENQ